MMREAAARAAAAAVFGAVLVWAAPAGADEDRCTGVTVVVDFGAAGSEAGMSAAPVAGCAADPGSGIEALTQAGFTVVEVGSFPGAVCRIDDFPETECGPMPPADASWSYWRVSEGEWSYSSVGAAGADPDAGDVEGWVFGDGSAPPGIEPGDLASASGPPSGEPGSAAAPTWAAAVVILAVIAGLAIWRSRRRRAP